MYPTLSRLGEVAGIYEILISRLITRAMTSGNGFYNDIFRTPDLTDTETINRLIITIPRAREGKITVDPTNVTPPYETFIRREDKERQSLLKTLALSGS